MDELSENFRAHPKMAEKRIDFRRLKYITRCSGCNAMIGTLDVPVCVTEGAASEASFYYHVECALDAEVMVPTPVRPKDE